MEQITHKTLYSNVLFSKIISIIGRSVNSNVDSSVRDKLVINYRNVYDAIIGVRLFINESKSAQ